MTPRLRRARLISRATNGLPPLASWIRTSSGRGWAMSSRSWMSRPRAPIDNGPMVARSRRSSGRASARMAAPDPSIPDRTASTNATSSDRRRRAAKASVPAVAGSHHWASSSPTTSGPPAARDRRTSSAARPSRAGSGARPPASARPVACSSARRRAGWRSSRTGSRSLSQQPDQRPERQGALGAAGPPGEDPVAAALGGCHRERPQRALADPGLAVDRQDARTRSAEDLVDRRALRVPPDDLE